jgi:hypothetical protein
MGCQQFEPGCIEAKSSRIRESKRSRYVEANVSSAPLIVEANIEKMSAQTELNDDPQRVESIAVRPVVGRARPTKKALRIVVTGATELAALECPPKPNGQPVGDRLVAR